MAEDEQIARRARRALWAFRLAFYPAAVAVAAILLIGRGDAVAGTEHLDGRTSQGASITLRFDDGRPVGLETRLAAMCPNGHRDWTPWRPADGERLRFRRDGSRLWALELVTIDYDNGNVGRGVYRFDAWVSDDRVEGTLEVVEHVDPAEGDDWACGSEPVGFTAQR
jgi:hypothetical protein